MCNCPETLIGKVRKSFPDHSCAEVRRRNTFIARAEQLAIEDTQGRDASAFNQAFSRHMERLCSGNTAYNILDFIK